MPCSSYAVLTVFAVLLLVAILSVPDESSFSDYLGRHVSGHLERKWGFSLRGLVWGLVHVQGRLGIRHARYDCWFFCLTQHSDYWFFGAFGLWIPLPVGNLHFGASKILNIIYLMVFLLWRITPRFMEKHFELSIENAAKRPWCMVLSNFSHQGVAHLISNIQVIGYLVPHLEEFMGIGNLFRLYLCGGMGAQMTSLVANSVMHGTRWVSKGASGSIYALLAYNAVMENGWKMSFNVLGFDCNSMGLLIARLVVDMGMLCWGGERGVDGWSHFGGVISGLVFVKWWQGELNIVGPKGEAEQTVHPTFDHL